MKKIALTGSIGMGKSTVAAMFAARGIPVFDADAEVRTLQGLGGELVAPIEARFPGTVRDGAIDRDMLAALVLGDPRRTVGAGDDRPPQGHGATRGFHRASIPARQPCCSTFRCCSKAAASGRSTR